MAGSTPSVTPNTVYGGVQPPAAAGGSSVVRPLPPLNPYPVQQPMTYNVPVQYGQHNPGAVQKPFQNYQEAPKISPYMNLYRRDNYTGIDNYNFYVKPALEEQARQQQMRNQLNSLEQQQNQAQRNERYQTTGTVGATYGRLNRGAVVAPGASYGFSGVSGMPIRPQEPQTGANADLDEKEKKDKAKEEDATASPLVTPTILNPYSPNNGFQFQFRPW